MSDYFVEPFVDIGLGNSAYIIGSHETKKGVLIDPLRDVDRYLASANQHGIQFTHVLDTHLHADFVSGSRELAAHTGAQIGASAEAKLGNETIKVYNPSISYLLGAAMNRYLIESRHNDVNCEQAMKDIFAAGYLHHFEWGCKDNDHTAWAIVEAESTEHARQTIPRYLREQARIVKVVKVELVNEEHTQKK